MFTTCAPTILSPLAAVAAALRPQDVHATTLFTGTNAALTVTTGVAAERLLIKARDVAVGHVLGTSLRGVNNSLATNSPNAYTSGTSQYGPQSLTATGFTLGMDNVGENRSGASNVAWSDKQADKYLKLRTFTHVAGTANTFDMSSLGVVGQVTIKRYDASGDWYTWHRGLTAGYNLKLNATDAQSTTNAYISVSGTTVTFAAGAPAGDYNFEAWAHDPDTTNGIIQCGSYTENAGQVTLGWQPQFLMIKAATIASDWYMMDAARGFSSTSDKYLRANLSNAETDSGNPGPINPNATGFTAGPFFGGTPTIVYLAIRAPT